MALLFPVVGENRALELIVNKTAQANLTLHLYSSNTTPASGDTISTYTECTGTGYASKTLTGSSFTVSGSTATYPVQDFSFTGADTVYGYYVLHGTVVLWAERFSGAPFNIPSSGGDVNVTPTVSAS